MFFTEEEEKRKRQQSTMNFCLPTDVGSISRRQLLKHGSSLAAFMTGSQLLASRYAIGQEAVDPIQRRLVWIMMNGGWDILEVTDPKVASTPGIDMSYDWALAQQVTGAPDGDKIGRWLSRTAGIGSDLVVVRGLNMKTTSHTAGRVYMDTGILSNSGDVNVASIPVIVASQSEATIPMIQLSGGMEALTDRATSNVSVVRAQNLELYRSMYPESDAELVQKTAVLDHLRNSADRVEALIGSNDRLTAVKNAESKIRTQFQNNVRSQLALTDEDMAAFRPTDGMRGNNGMTETFAMAAKLIKNNLVTSLNLGVGNFDTHSNQEARMQPVVENFDFMLSTFVNELRNSGDLDTTLICVVSDFGRTPLVNNGNGRDHWPVGGALMLGGGIEGSRVVGATDDNLRALPINETTGAQDSSGVLIDASHLGGSVVDLCLGTDFYAEKRSGYLASIPALTKLKTG